MKKYLTHIASFILGSLIFGGIGVFATMSVTNNVYPITINGTSASINGYNINGNTYFKLRDIGDSVGFGVNFNTDTNTIEITKKEEDDNMPNGNTVSTDTSTSTIINQSTIREYTLTDDNTKTSDGINISIRDGKKGVHKTDIADKYNFKEKGYSFGHTKLYSEKDGIILDNIPNIDDFNSNIELYYYETVLVPILETL